MTAPAEPYWHSEISTIEDGKVYVRGYDLENLIGRIPFTASIFLLIRGRLPVPAETDVLDAVLTAVLDYALHKPGTAAARYVVSANPDMAAGIAAAALAVGKHTLATEDTARFIVETHASYKASGAPSLREFAEVIVAERSRNRSRIPGFGHPLFKRVDPRAARLRETAEKAGLWSEACRLYEEIHRVFTATERKADIPINDVGMMAAVMIGLGFTPEESTGVAFLSTVPGVIAHVSEEFRTGRPIRVVPDTTASYDVVTDRDFDHDWKAAGWNREV